jgi:hypothetical protein
MLSSHRGRHKMWKETMGSFCCRIPVQRADVGREGDRRRLYMASHGEQRARQTVVTFNGVVIVSGLTDTHLKG